MRNRLMSILARLAFAAFLISLSVGFVAGLGTRLHLFGYATGFIGIFPFCPYAALAGVVLGFAWALGALITNIGTAAGYAVAGLAGSLALLAVPLYDYVMVEIVHAIPPIHDISTDTEHPPAFVALLSEREGAANPPGYDGPKLVKTYDGSLSTTMALQKKYYSDIHSIGVLIPPAKLFGRALDAAQAMDWQIVAAVPDAQGGRIEAISRSFLFGLVDDIVIRVKPAGMGARIDIRSKSRDGDNDLGRNAADIRAFAKKLAEM